MITSPWTGLFNGLVWLSNTYFVKFFFNSYFPGDVKFRWLGGGASKNERDWIIVIGNSLKHKPNRAYVGVPSIIKLQVADNRLVYHLRARKTNVKCVIKLVHVLYELNNTAKPRFESNRIRRNAKWEIILIISIIEICL